MKNAALACLTVLATTTSCRVSNKIVYPDRMENESRAELFAEGVISTDGFQHGAAVFSPNGKKVLWSNMSETWKGVIMEMENENGKWSAPHRVSFCDTAASDVYPSFAPDGQTLYFSSSRKLPSGMSPRGNHLWRVERTAAGWGIPAVVDSAATRNNEYAVSINRTGDLYFTHGPFRSSDWNLRMSRKTDSGFESPISLDAINTSGYEDGPFVAPDGSYLIFESDRPGGSGGIDLYISFRSGNQWLSPLNMGSKINTEAAERFGRVSPDGKYLFFGSNRRVVNGKQNFDVYWIGAGVIEELRGKSWQ